MFWEGHKIWLALHRTKVRRRFLKILWPSQNIWTLMIIKVNFEPLLGVLVKFLLQFDEFFWNFLKKLRAHLKICQMEALLYLCGGQNQRWWYITQVSDWAVACSPHGFTNSQNPKLQFFTKQNKSCLFIGWNFFP